MGNFLMIKEHVGIFLLVCTFQKKSIVVSKTLEMVDLTMALFAKFHINGSWKNITSLFS